jgi:hypothetical protein
MRSSQCWTPAARELLGLAVRDDGIPRRHIRSPRTITSDNPDLGEVREEPASYSGSQSATMAFRGSASDRSRAVSG